MILNMTNLVFRMSKDDVMADFVAYESEMMDYEVMMAAHDNELMMQWEDQQDWCDFGCEWDQ